VSICCEGAIVDSIRSAAALVPVTFDRTGKIELQNGDDHPVLFLSVVAEEPSKVQKRAAAHV
jgi:hypothetical protein